MALTLVVGCGLVIAFGPLDFIDNVVRVDREGEVPIDNLGQPSKERTSFKVF